MESKKTTGSQSSLSEKPRPVRGAGFLDQEQIQLTENDCWFYQAELERLMRNYLTDAQMVGRPLAIIQAICAQARRCARIDEERRKGHYKGLDNE